MGCDKKTATEDRRSSLFSVSSVVFSCSFPMFVSYVRFLCSFLMFVSYVRFLCSFLPMFISYVFLPDNFFSTEQIRVLSLCGFLGDYCQIGNHPGPNRTRYISH